MKKVPVIEIYRYYFFGLFRREIKLAYEVKEGKVIFKEKPRKTDTVIITYKYEEERNEKRKG